MDGRVACRCRASYRRKPISRISRIDPLYRQTAVGIGFGLLIAIVLASTLAAMQPPPSGPGPQELVAVPPVSASPGGTGADPAVETK